jgi:hypothetical protein
MVRIIRGLKEGEKVSLTPPLVEAAVKESESVPEPLPSPSPAPSPSPPAEGKGSGPGTGEPGSSPENRFMGSLDKNGDGKVSRDEFPGRDEVFKRLDRDGDGYISMSEVPKRPQGGGSPSGFGPPRGDG